MIDAVVVIRSQGERTEAVCERLVKSQFENTHIIRVSPFADAVRECFRIGLESGSEWLVTVDADVLIAPDYREKISEEVKVFSGWQILGHMDDKLFGGVRRGGVRAYRTSAIPKLLPSIRDGVQRVEARLCADHPGWRLSSLVTGRHDYEQYYRDLYRKGAAHRAKHRNWATMIERAWGVSGDKDLQAAYAGWHGRELMIDEKPEIDQG